MGIITRTGAWIGLITVAWTFVMGLTGWYKDPVLLNAFFLVVLVEIALIWWGLRQTARTNSYAEQVMAGTSMALVAAAIIFVGSYLFTTVFFPDYFDQLRAAQEQLLRQQGVPEADIQTQLAAGQPFATPLWNALFGVIGTVVTGLVTSLVLGSFLRRRV